MQKIIIPAVKIMKDGRITIDKKIRETYGISKGTIWKLTLEKISEGSDSIVSV